MAIQKRNYDLLTKALEDSIRIERARKAAMLVSEAQELEKIFLIEDLASSTAYMKCFLHERGLTQEYERWLMDMHSAFTGDAA